MDNQVVSRPTGITMRLKPMAMIKNIAIIKFGLNSIIVRITPEASVTDAAAATVVFNQCNERIANRSNGTTNGLWDDDQSR